MSIESELSKNRDAIDEQYYNASGQISRDGWNEVMTGGKHGLIDLDGTWAALCEFSDITCGYEGKYLLRRDEGDGVQPEYIFGEDGTRPVKDERYQCIGCISEGVVFAQKGGSWRWDNDETLEE